VPRTIANTPRLTALPPPIVLHTIFVVGIRAGDERCQCRSASVRTSRLKGGGWKSDFLARQLSTPSATSNTHPSPSSASSLETRGRALPRVQRVGACQRLLVERVEGAEGGQVRRQRGRVGPREEGRMSRGLPWLACQPRNLPPPRLTSCLVLLLAVSCVTGRLSPVIPIGDGLVAAVACLPAKDAKCEDRRE
jgi:hypothetical protein